MAEHPFTAEDLETLRQWDTPTICNALEFVAPARRGHGFTVRPMVCADPKLFSRDAAAFAKAAAALDAAQAALAEAEEEWLRLEMLREELET